MAIKVKANPAIAAAADTKVVQRVSVPNLKRDRLGTLSFLSWYDRTTVQNARVMVVGAGALGNEVLKNLALMGVGNIYIVDMDDIEAANLSRSVLFRASDAGRYKAEVAAERLREINPDIYVQSLNGSMMLTVGAGLVRRMDVVIGCLDNREARWQINELCYRVGVPWVEGAIEGLEGKIQVFDPATDHACYNCTLSDAALRDMSLRRSCKVFAARDVLHGKVPTTSIAGSIIGAIQVQEALKLLHKTSMGHLINPSVEYRYNGLNNDFFGVRAERKDYCDQHFQYDDITEIVDATAANVTGADLLAAAEQYSGESCTLRLGYDLILRAACSVCRRSWNVIRAAHAMEDADYDCPHCGAAKSAVIDEINDVTNKILSGSPLAQYTLADLAVPPLAILEIFTASQRLLAFELTGDCPAFGLNAVTASAGGRG